MALKMPAGNFERSRLIQTLPPVFGIHCSREAAQLRLAEGRNGAGYEYCCDGTDVNGRIWAGE